MCGIAGFITTRQRARVEQVRAMTDRLRHRGPNAAGVLLVESRTKTTWSGEGLTMHAISNVDMCEECTDGSCDGGDGGDDGCIEGCDDGSGDGSGSGSGSGDGSGSDGPLT